VARALLLQLTMGNAPQLGVHDRKELIERRAVACAPGKQ
jgi:hypothetical protein